MVLLGFGVVGGGVIVIRALRTNPTEESSPGKS